MRHWKFLRKRRNVALVSFYCVVQHPTETETETGTAILTQNQYKYIRNIIDTVESILAILATFVVFRLICDQVICCCVLHAHADTLL